MRRYIAYWWYVVVHKAWVIYEGRKLGLGWWRLIIHDMSKFNWSKEFVPYARYFYNPDGSERPYDSGQSAAETIAFKQAWEHHKENNDHHWDHWGYDVQKKLRRISDAVIPGSDGQHIPMPESAMLEMIADWRAMAHTKGGSAEEFYHNRKHTIHLHPYTRKQVELILGSEYRE